MEAEMGVMLTEAKDAWGRWKLESIRRTLLLEISADTLMLNLYSLELRETNDPMF